jgi:hypothetical protein
MSISRKQEFRIYKPRNSGDGAATAFQVKVVLDEETNIRKCYLFLVGTPQIGKDEKGNAAFAWKDQEKTVTVKLGVVDIGEFLSVLSGKKQAVGTGKGLYHQNQTGSTSVDFKSTENGYTLRLNKKVGTVVGTPVQHGITVGEAEILKILLEDFVRLNYKWS